MWRKAGSTLARWALALFALLNAAPYPAPAEERVPPITVAELAALPQGSYSLIDANSPYVRRKDGTLPGAVRIYSTSDYDPAVLPSSVQKLVVFYCWNRL